MFDQVRLDRPSGARVTSDPLVARADRDHLLQGSHLRHGFAQIDVGGLERCTLAYDEGREATDRQKEPEPEQADPSLPGQRGPIDGVSASADRSTRALSKGNTAVS